MPHRWNRRAFLQSAAVLPFAAALRGGAWLPRGNPRTLLVLELEGGNDGLNTVIPLDDARYAQLRPTLQSARRGALPLGAAPGGGGFGLHMALAKVHARVLAGSAAVLHAVGYPSPDRSHFRSRDIWHTADPRLAAVRADTTGWLGRAADRLATAGAGLPAAEIGGTELPLLLRSANAMVPSLRRAEDFALQVDDAAGAGPGRRAAIEALAAPRADQGLVGEVAHVASAAIEQAGRLRAALQRYQPRADYPDSPLGRDLQLVARMAIAGFGTRLLHTGLGGFDTHARQLPTQQALLQELDLALDALLQDLGRHDALADTLVLVHSEFGRRVLENDSQGTDHGAAAPVLLLGGGVRGGVHGKGPDLGDLLDGDVRPTTDFRSVYRDLLDWLSIDAASVLDGEFAPAGACAR